ncbi:very long-chain acyl-CoA synthetase-like [Rana temporaria]|uniref:very long-chain acyl-CoA synthetase-like n=1 Tax=Rana temporaria TaxID=8407 RepID=UPI001AAD14A0|nr:very long-chain acyl-CoA synthetase-like [Rana temporaria]XP_040198812.1 very long-chain acyl-CoA synthetase-like [Rana temporaria]XP_040198813.1 very long-chain acyl-CoA synthetase-like [Rana temporaria]
MPIIQVMFFWIIPLWIAIKRIFPKNLWQDFKFCIKLIHYVQKVERSVKHCPSPGMLDVFLQQVSARPNQAFILYQDQAHTYRDIDITSNQAAWALREHAKVKTGDCVVIFAFNEPSYVWTWLAVAKLGCSMACLNYNLRAKSFLHCFKISGARVLIASPVLKDAVDEVLPTLLEEGVLVYYLNRDSFNDGTHSLLDKMEASSEDSVPESFRSDVSPQSPALYIYTSGTTGLPKAATITQKRVLTSCTVSMLTGLTSKDVLYIPLPLYHSSGLLIGLRGCIQVGATCLLRNKFSVTEFWNDCRKYNVTAFMYIGEIVRYLYNAPKKTSDKDHSVKFCIGNGVRADIWRDFTNRFGNITLYEIYGATEGNAFFFNYSNKAGAIGRYNIFLKLLQPFEVIKYDTERNEPVLDHRGRCIQTERGEPGLLIAKIIKSNPFSGYARNESQTKKKIIQNVLKKGDMYFNSGDLVMVDKEGFVYFHDRIGDTFRWKGENVATTEVENIVSTMDFIEQSNVFGVPVPYHEGRIGMASVTLKEGRSFDGEKLYAKVADYLPSYARPRFVRVQDSMEVTGTYKLNKLELVKEGFNPVVIKDPLYFLDEKVKSYVPMNNNIYQAILEKKFKL